MSDQKQLITITQSETPALEDPKFELHKSKAEHWLSLGKKALGKDMDNVFFNDERFELMVDTRGYGPEDVKCTVGPSCIEIVALKQESSPASTRTISTTRNYQLPQCVNPQSAVCCLSPEGFLLVVVPWLK